MRIVRYLLILAVIALGISFAWLNARAVTLSYYAGTVEVPLALALVGVLIVGWVLGIASIIPVQLRLRRRLAAAERRHRIAERQLGDSRAPQQKGD